MAFDAVAAFESIESAEEYLALLAQVVLESQEAVQADIEENAASESSRYVEALRIIAYNLEKLAQHIRVSRRILNDLRMLRRILYREDTGDNRQSEL
jgi:hypothetical protein